MTWRRPELLLALISLPALFLFVVDALWIPADYFNRQGEQNLEFIANVIFFNILHVFLSFYLVYKIKEFRELYAGFLLPLLASLTLLFILALDYANFTTQAFYVFAGGHALFQSMGLFLLYFCKSSYRRWIKISCWLAWIYLILRYFEIIHFDNSVSCTLAVIFFLVFVLATPTPWGLLFAFRFLLWLWTTPINGFSISALHGLEYLIVVGTLITSPQVPLKKIDYILICSLVAIPGGYLAYSHFNQSIKVVDILLMSSVFLHYLMDTYSFRFSLALPRQLILPLFIKR